MSISNADRLIATHCFVSVVGTSDVCVFCNSNTIVFRNPTVENINKIMRGLELLPINLAKHYPQKPAISNDFIAVVGFSNSNLAIIREVVRSLPAFLEKLPENLRQIDFYIAINKENNFVINLKSFKQ